MIPLTRHLDPHLAELLAQVNLTTRSNPAGGDLICDVLSFRDRDAAQQALAGYHAERWNRSPGQAGPASIRLSDLGELIAALLLHAHGIHVPGDIYPLTFTSPGPTAQPAGIDVLGAHLDLGVGPLASHECLSVAEAKSTLATDAANAIGAVQDDVRKCTAERVSDSLFVLKWEYERTGNVDHLRIPLLVTSNCTLYGSIVIDPVLCDPEKTVASIFTRLEGRIASNGARLARIFLLCLPNALAFIEGTL